MRRHARLINALAALAALAMHSWLGCANGDKNDNHNDAGTNDAAPPLPVLESIDPAEGPVAGGTAVELTGQNLWGDLTVSFGGEPATDVVVHSGARVTCVTPPAAAPGPVTVRVVNELSQSSQLLGGFTYLGEDPPVITWCQLHRPAATAAGVGQASEPIFGRVHAEGITDGPGQGAGVTGQLGFGPVGSDPTDAAWTWADAVYVGDASQLFDEYAASVTAAAVGDYDYAYRFSLDAGAAWLHCDLDGASDATEYSPSQAGSLAVGAVPVLTLAGVDLPRGSIAGGSTVTLNGIGFVAATQVFFGATPSPSVTSVSATELLAEVPPGAVGVTDVTVENPGNVVDTLTDGFEYLLVGSPTVNGDLGDWPAGHLVATNSILSSWTSTNELRELYVAFDDTTLYVGIDGTVNVDNAIVAYLDVDFGSATGVTDTDVITDQTGAFDATVGGHPVNGSLQFAIAGFGADFVVGSKGMNEVFSNLSDNAGWRGLSNPSDLAWLTGTVDAGTHLLECSIPIATLWPGGVPTGGVAVAIVVKIADPDGQTFADQTLPEEAATSTVTQHYVFSVFSSGEF
ncbi:MAG: IPT/TIG domain-containing protein [bacterium]